MKITIFARLVIGFLAIFILAMAVSVYAIIQLRKLERDTQSIILIDGRLSEYEKKLGDLLLSQMRYEKKFIISPDDELYTQFLSAEKEFYSQLAEIKAMTDSPVSISILEKIQLFQEHYKDLFNIEVQYLTSGQTYNADDYKSEKEIAVNGITEGLNAFRLFNERNTYNKVKELGKAEVKASKVAIVIGLASLFLGTIISIFITLNITKPLLVIKKRTRDIAKGEFGKDLELTSPPEIGELARAFNTMCNKLKEIDKIKTDFYSFMSHELRTPLTTINEGTNLLIEGLNDKGENKKEQRLLRIIKEESNRMISLVNSLLDLSKMEAGMMEFNFVLHDIKPLIHQVTREIEPIAEKREIRIESDITNKLPKVKIDVNMILQVLRNLLVNAVKFTPKGGNIRVFTKTIEDQLQVSVKDNGPGISEEHLDIIFDKFQQVNILDSNKITGTGLGLSIVKHIIIAHGGKVWVKSILGQGSVFTFALPV
ncbi:MAG: HAMP domain-containing protein [Nitrospiraceae bacterium]|nr:MAG: HAMP domain-containing protein [Nitrospiraceae bacterium]